MPTVEADTVNFLKQQPAPQSTLRQEYDLAHNVLQDTGKLPINIDKNCLNCMQPGRDTKDILRGFKMACLSYAPSNVNYREHNMTRVALIGVRRGLIDNAIETIQNCALFNKENHYPRRYFDDLILDQQMARR